MTIDYTEIRASTWSSYFFAKKFFFRTPSCLEELRLYNNYFFVKNTFSDQPLLEYKYFLTTATVMFRRNYFLRISNYSKHALFRSRRFFRTATFSEEQLFYEQVFLEKSHSFLIASLRNQLHCINTWKDFMAGSDFETPQFFVIENSKQCMNFNTDGLQMWLFRKLVVIVVSSNKL